MSAVCRGSGEATLRLPLLLPFLLLLLIYLLLDNSREEHRACLASARPSINRLHLCAEFLTAMDSCDTERLIVHQDGSTATAATASITASGGSGGGTASDTASTASTTSTRQQPSLLRLRRNTVYNNYHVIFLIRMHYSPVLTCFRLFTRSDNEFQISFL